MFCPVSFHLISFEFALHRYILPPLYNISCTKISYFVSFYIITPFTKPFCRFSCTMKPVLYRLLAFGLAVNAVVALVYEKKDIFYRGRRKHNQHILTTTGVSRSDTSLKKVVESHQHCFKYRSSIIKILIIRCQLGITRYFPVL